MSLLSQALRPFRYYYFLTVKMPCKTIKEQSAAKIAKVCKSDRKHVSVLQIYRRQKEMTSPDCKHYSMHHYESVTRHYVGESFHTSSHLH